MKAKRNQMGLDSRLRYYEAFVCVRDVLRTIELACAVQSTRAELSESERTAFKVQQLRWNCTLCAMESKRRNYDTNIDAVYVPWSMELRAIEQLAEEAHNIDAEHASIIDLYTLGTESANFFTHLHP